MQTNTFLKLIVAFQAILVLMIFVHEQQRRTLWNNDVAARVALEQRAKDIEELREKPIATYANLVEKIGDLQARITLVQIATASLKQSDDLAADTNARILRLEQTIAKLTADK